MHTALRKIGSSTGMIVPKTLLNEMGLAVGAAIDLNVEDGKLVASPIRKVREGWSEAAAELADEDDPELEDWIAFGNEGDDDWSW